MTRATLIPFEPMDIYILQNGEETGPFSIETARTLLKQGTVAEADFAWRPGMPKWIPLSELLASGPAIATEVTPLEKAPATKADPATPKQKAFLSYFGIPITAELTRDQAALLVNDTMEEASNAERLARWNEERRRLHPELFAAEIQARKENRANHFFELCQSSGAQYFSGVAKAHCQVLVGFLDVKFPNWDARESEAAEHYFFPAVAEKFPQLVHKEWRGRLHYADGTKISHDIVRKSPTSKLRRTATSPLVATARGLVLGVVILGALYLAQRTVQTDTIAATATTPPAEPATPSTAVEQAPAPAPALAAAPETAPIAPQNLPPIEPAAPVPPVAQAEPAPVAPPAATAETPTAPAPAVPTPAGAVVATAPMAGTTPPPMAAADPTMAPVAPMATMPTALDTAPMATLPGKEPPVPVAPPPVTMPMAGSLPNAPATPTEPIPTAVPAPNEYAASIPPLPVAKTNLVLTKPVEIALTYGKIMLSPGTPVKLVTRQGAVLKVSYQNRVITIPAGSTDIE